MTLALSLVSKYILFNRELICLDHLLQKFIKDIDLRSLTKTAFAEHLHKWKKIMINDYGVYEVHVHVDPS